MASVELSTLLIKHEDSELRLLDTIRTCFSQRLKCDRDYAINLQIIASTGTRFDFLKDTKSSLAAAWNVVSQETEVLSKLIRKRTECLIKEVIEPLDSLIEDRKQLKKNYFDETTRINSDLEKVTSVISKTKLEYERAHATYQLYRSKYMDLTKSLPTQSMEANANSSATASRRARNYSEAKKKYLKSAKKLHLLHNEYVILIKEGQLLGVDSHTKLRPYFAGQQLAHLNESNDKIKDILESFVAVTDFTGDLFQATQWRIKNYMSSVREKDDYKDIRSRLTQANQWPTIKRNEKEIRFESKLVDWTQFDGNLKENELAVDTFTYDSLKNVQFELQTKLVQCQQELRSKEKLVHQKESEVTALSFLCTSDREATLVANATPLTFTAKRNSKAMSSVATRIKTISIIKKELLEVETRHDRVYKIWQQVDNALTNVNETAVPVGLATLDHHGSPVTVSMGVPTDLDDRTIRPRSETPSGVSNTYSVASFSVKYIVSKIGHAKDSVQALAARTLHSHSSTTSGHYNHGDNKSGNSGLKLEDELWYHGALPREDVVKLIKQNGDYLVRETTKGGVQRPVISLISNEQVKHFLISVTEDNCYKLEGPTFTAIGDLLDYHRKHDIPLTMKSGCTITNAILRQSWELEFTAISLKEKIGKGNFGDVFRGTLKSIHPTNSTDEVAVKTCRVNLPDEQKRMFLQEARILQQYCHQNIVRFIGICVQKEPIMLVMELVAGGSLLTFLRENRATDVLQVGQLLRMSLDTSAGMAYLESKNCIHRDLAARNCLVLKGDQTVVKISDFGMSREAEHEYCVSSGLKQIPVKWTAPEALNYGRYTSLCDVWSFGVLLWEIFSLGSVPYAGMSNAKARQLIDEGYRLPAPPNTPMLVYQLMKTCWNYEPKERNRFDRIYKRLDDMYKSYVKFKL